MKFDIKIDEALAVLQKNLSEHEDEFKTAVEVWTQEVKTACENLSEAVSTKNIATDNNQLYRLYANKPQDNRKEYEKVIGAMMLAAKTGQKIIQMDEEDYDRVFNDNFDWRTRSKFSNSAYGRPGDARP